MPDVQNLSPAGVAALIARFRDGLIEPEAFINGLAAQDVVLSPEASQSLLEAQVITPDQFEMISGRNTQRLSGSQGFLSKLQNFAEGIGQESGLVGEAGETRGEQAFEAGTTALSLLPFGFGTAGKIPGAATLFAPSKIPFTGGRIGSAAELLSFAGSGGAGVSQILEHDRAGEARFQQAQQGVVSTTTDELGDPEAEFNAALSELAAALGGEGATNGAASPDLTGEAGELPPFEFLDIPGLGRLVRIREEIIDEFGQVIGFRFGEPIRVPDEEQEVNLDSNTLLAVSEALADPASALQLQAGFARLVNNAGPGGLDPTTAALADLLGIRPGQSSLDVGGLPSDVLSLFGIEDGQAPIAGTDIVGRSPSATRDVAINEGGGSRSSQTVTLPGTVTRTKQQGLDLQRIPNLNALSPREISALQALSNVQGLNFDDIAEQSELVTPPGGTRRRATVSR